MKCAGLRKYVFVATLISFTSASLVAHGHGTGELPPPGPKGVAMPMMLPSSGSFVNFETAQVHPLDINPAGDRLAACNTADGRIEIYAINSGTGALTHLTDISVGYDPVSVRFRTDSEAWVVNHVSDSVSIVDLNVGHVVKTIETDDEPADVAFFTDAGNAAPLAAVSCSRVDKIQLFHATAYNLVGELEVMGEDPRSLATDGTTVYAAIFNSGNSTTIIGHVGISGPAGAITDAGNPYGGQHPHFNDGIPGTAWVTDMGSKTPADLTFEGKPQPPIVGVIVRKDYADLAGDGKPKWKDDNGADWTDWVRGAQAAKSRRMPGWDMIDNDVLSFGTSSSASTVSAGFGASGYVINQMNILMNIARNPVNGSIVTVGTEATNEQRFEPNLNGIFARVMASIVHGTTGAQIALTDLNEEHLDAAQGGAGLAYSDSSVPQSERDKSIGDPRDIAFHPSGARFYVPGMGSNNIVVVDAATGERLGGVGHTLAVGTGPTGVAHHGTLNRLYVLNRFSATISVVDTSTVGSESVTQTVAYFDPTPDFINEGRVHFYDTHKNSGLGQIACASCHIDGAMDRLSWDLGDPFGEMKPTQLANLGMPGVGEHNLSFTSPGAFDDFHFMKGPMTTQTLQDIIGKEPHHWRGDRDGIEEFAGAFPGLQGRDDPLDAPSMQEFENFLSSIHFMPNPFRAPDNSLAGGPKFVGAGNNPLLPLPGLFTSGRFAAEGTQLPDGDAWRGFQLYVDGNPLAVGSPPLDSDFNCVTCHALPMGAGSIDFAPFLGSAFFDIAPGPLGELHQSLVSVDGTGEKAFKTPHLRNQLDKKGLYLGPDPMMGGLPRMSRAGFGVLHDGSIAGIDEFLASGVFEMTSDQDIADVVAFTLSMNGDDFAEMINLAGSPIGIPAGVAGVRDPGPDGGEGLTAHASVGKQVTISGAPSMAQADLINLFIALADSDVVGLIVKGVTPGGQHRGWYRGVGVKKSSHTFISDINGAEHSLAQLLAIAATGAELSFTVVPTQSGARMGVDRDEDTFFDFSEILAGSNPADPNSTPANVAQIPASTGWSLWLMVLGVVVAMAVTMQGYRRVRN